MAEQAEYQRICAEECEWCAKGYRQYSVTLTQGSRQYHLPCGFEGDIVPCTAPDRDTVIDRLAGELERRNISIQEGKDAQCELAGELEQANTLIRLTFEEYEKAIADNPALSGLGPYDGNPLKAWHGLYGWLMDNAKQLASRLETISGYASRTAGELERVRAEAAKMGHESGCASHKRQRRAGMTYYETDTAEEQNAPWYFESGPCNCAQSRIQGGTK